MINKKAIVEEKLSYLYERLEELRGVSRVDHQVGFLMEEIDYYRAELLKLEVREYYELVENEND